MRSMLCGTGLAENLVVDGQVSMVPRTIFGSQLILYAARIVLCGRLCPFPHPLDLTNLGNNCRFTDHGHHRQLPRLVSGPFRFKTFAADYLERGLRLAQHLMKQVRAPHSCFITQSRHLTPQSRPLSRQACCACYTLPNQIYQATHENSFWQTCAIRCGQESRIGTTVQTD